MPDFVQKYQVLVALAIIAFVFVAWELRLIIAMLLAGYVFAAGILPAVDYLTRKKIPRILAVLAVYAAIAGVFVLAGALLAEPLREGIRGLASYLPEGGKGSLFGSLGTLDLNPEVLLGAFDSNLLGIAGSTLSVISMIAVSLVISIYLVYDWHGIRDSLSAIGGRQKLVLRIIENQVSYLGAWMRGQLILSAIVGTLVFVALTIVRLPFAPALALAAGVFELVPYAGSFLAAIPALLIAFESGTQTVIIVGAIYVAIQQFENHVLVPLVMKRAIHVHPLIIIVAALVGFAVMGIFGAVLAVPLAAMVQTTYATIRDAKE